MLVVITVLLAVVFTHFLRGVELPRGELQVGRHEDELGFEVHHVAIGSGHVAEGFDGFDQAGLAERGAGDEVAPGGRPERAGVAGREPERPEHLVHLDRGAETEPLPQVVERAEVIVDNVLARERQHLGVGLGLHRVRLLRDRTVLDLAGRSDFLVFERGVEAECGDLLEVAHRPHGGHLPPALRDRQEPIEQNLVAGCREQRGQRVRAERGLNHLPHVRRRDLLPAVVTAHPRVSEQQLLQADAVAVVLVCRFEHVAAEMLLGVL
jgi:hypothetical protein